MPRKVVQTTVTNVSSNVINAIRNVTDLKNYIPACTGDAEELRKIGNIIIDSPNLRNTFCDALVNRIAKVILQGRSYTNPLAFLKSGVLDYGETIEEIFTDIINAVEWDADVDASERNAVKKPDVKSCFHISNFRKHYDVSISRNDLKRAFTEESGMVSLVDKIVSRLYDSMNYDEYLIIKYLISASLCTNKIGALEVGSITSNPKSVLVDIKDTTARFTNMSTKYNVLGVHNVCPLENQLLILSARAKALLDVEALATLFHLEKADLEQRIITIDDWSEFDGDRVKNLLGEDYYYNFSDTELTMLRDEFYGVLIDSDFLQIYDHELEMDSDYNGVNQIIKYCLHKWSTFAISPFANAIAFTDNGCGVITAITLSANTVGITTNDDGETTTDIVLNIGGFVSGLTGSKTIYDKSLKYSLDNSSKAVSGITLTDGVLRIVAGTDISGLASAGIVVTVAGVKGTASATFTVSITVPEE